MNLSELQSVQAGERQSDGLQELRPSFYRDAAEYIDELREKRARTAAEVEDPFEDPTVTQLSDDIRTAEQTVEAIYERRVGKVVKLASLAAAGMPSDEGGLTTEEQELYETLVDAIEHHREDVLATLSGDATSGDVDLDAPAASDGSAEGGAAASDGSDGSVDAADLMGADDGDDRVAVPPDGAPPGREPPPADAGGSDGSSGSAAPADGGSADGAPDEDRRTVRITEDVGAILGVDEREYDLATDDVVTLPAENADPLIERDAAEPLE